MRVGPRKRRWLAAGLAALLLFGSGGCWDYRQLNDRAFVLMMGIDLGPDAQGYHVTIQKIIGQYLPGAQAGGGGGGGGSGKTPYMIKEADGRSIPAALEGIREKVHRDLDLSHLKVIVLGEDLARQKDLRTLDAIPRDMKIAATVFLSVTHGQARDVVMAPNRAEDVPALYVFHGYTGKYTRSLAVLAVPIWYAFDRTQTSPLIDTAAGGLEVDSQGEANFAGTAVWRGGEMAGWLSEGETAMLNFFLGFKGLDDFLQTEGEPCLSLRLTRGQVKRWADWDPDGTVVLHLRIQTAGMLVASDGPIVTPADEIRAENALAEEQKKKVEALIHHLQELASDPLGFGERLRRVDSTAPEVQSRQAWEEAYKRARVEVDSGVTFYERGLVR